MVSLELQKTHVFSDEQMNFIGHVILLFRLRTTEYDWLIFIKAFWYKIQTDLNTLDAFFYKNQ